MAYRRSLITSARLISRQRFAPSFAFSHHEDDRQNPHSDKKGVSFLQSRSYGCFGGNNSTDTPWLGFGGMSYRDPKRSQFLHVPMTTNGFLLARNMSTTIGDVVGEQNIKCTTDLADVVADKMMEVVSSQAAAVSEVAVAAADSWPPVAAFQYFIDGVHTYTGVDWWLSIVITTLVIRMSLVPLNISQRREFSIRYKSLTQEVDQIWQEIRSRRDISKTYFAEGKEREKKLYEKLYGIGGLILFKGLLIQLPIFFSFFFAIRNMVEKVPSFQTGGISWFIDLTTRDSFYILPFVTAFSYWLSLESNRTKGNPNDVIKTNIRRGKTALTFPLAASFPNAYLCSWITSKSFSLVYRQIIKKPSVKKLLNIVEPPTSESKVDYSLEVLKRAAVKPMRKRQGETKPTITNQSISSSSLLSQKPTSEEHNF